MPICLILTGKHSHAREFSETSYLVASIGINDLGNQNFWSYIQSNNNAGIEINLSENDGDFFIDNSNVKFEGC